MGSDLAHTSPDTGRETCLNLLGKYYFEKKSKLDSLFFEIRSWWRAFMCDRAILNQKETLTQ